MSVRISPGSNARLLGHIKSLSLSFLKKFSWTLLSWTLGYSNSKTRVRSCDNSDYLLCLFRVKLGPVYSIRSDEKVRKCAPLSPLNNIPSPHSLWWSALHLWGHDISLQNLTGGKVHTINHKGQNFMTVNSGKLLETSGLLEGRYSLRPLL